MKRTGNLFDEIFEWKNLRSAYLKALKGKRERRDARKFAIDFDRRLHEMSERLRSGEFPVGRFHQFVIRDPKERLITAPCFEERVLQQAVMNVCEPVLERWLIHDSYACRQGRGRDLALQRAKTFAHRYPYFLKLDIRKYFDSIWHEVLLAKLARLFKEQRLLDLFARILAGFEGERRRGLPIGSLTSQHFANFYLGWFDRFVKETLAVCGYVRYMDDMLLWGPSSDEMSDHLARSREFLAETLQLEFKPHPYINCSWHGVDFLGCRVLPDHVELNRRGKRRFAHRMAELENDYLTGRVDERELQVRAESLVAFTRSAGARSWQFRSAVLQGLPVSGRRPPPE